MLARQLKNYMATVLDDANILVFVNKTNEVRQLRFSDIDVDQDGNVIIDAEYFVPPKHTTIKREEL